MGNARRRADTTDTQYNLLLNGARLDNSKMFVYSGELEGRGKSVAFGQNETHQYNGYDSRGTTSTQNSYRQPEVILLLKV